MSNTSFGRLISDLRRRQHWTREYLLAKMNTYNPDLFRLETGSLLPDDENLNVLKNTVGIDLAAYSTPLHEDVPLQLYASMDLLEQALDNEKITLAQSLYDELIQFNVFHKPTSRQFMLCQQARLREQQGTPYTQLLPLTIEAIQLTLDDFNGESPGNKFLFPQEVTLFYLLGRIYCNTHRHEEGVRVLSDTYNGLLRLPMSARNNEKRTVPILLTLAQFYLREKNYTEAIDICQKGWAMSTQRSSGTHVPDFVMLLTKSLIPLQRTDECEPYLKGAYASYLMLGKKDAADEAFSLYRSLYNKTFETFGMEKIDLAISWQPYQRGNIPPCRTIGEMIFALRDNAKLTRQQLARGICSQSNLAKIETNDIHAHLHHVEPLLQRLGRETELYTNFFLSKDDFDARELRDEIQSLLTFRKYDKAAELLKKLQVYKAYKPAKRYVQTANLLFVQYVEAIIETTTLADEISIDEIINKFTKVLQASWPAFDENNTNAISVEPLSLVEALIILRIGAYRMRNEEYKKASKILEALIDNINQTFVDEREKFRVYLPLLTTYSACLGRMGRRDEAMEIIEESLTISRSRRRLTSQIGITGNKAHTLFKKERPDESLAHYALCYYSATLFVEYGHKIDIDIAQKRAKEFFNVTFN